MVGVIERVFEVLVNPEYVARTFALSSAQVLPGGPVYQLTVYGVKPVAQEYVRFSDSPASIEGFIVLVVGAARPNATKKLPEYMLFAFVPSESVTTALNASGPLPA